MSDNGEMNRRIAANNMQRNVETAKKVMARAKAARDQTNRAFADMKAKCDQAANTLEAIVGPLSKFLVNHCGHKDGTPMPMWDDLYYALCKALPECGHVPDQDPPNDRG